MPRTDCPRALAGCQLDDSLRAAPGEGQPSATVAVAMDHVVNTFDARAAGPDRAQADTSIEDLRIGQSRYERTGPSQERLCLFGIDGFMLISRLIRATNDRAVI
jgi:hypothetical protein